MAAQAVHRRVLLVVGEIEVAVLEVAHQQAVTFQMAADPLAEALDHSLQCGVCRRCHPPKAHPLALDGVHIVKGRYFRGGLSALLSLPGERLRDYPRANNCYLIRSRLSRIMDEVSAAKPGDFLNIIERSAPASLKVRVVDAMTTNETLWFRDEYPFEILKDAIFAELGGPRGQSIRIWSAASSYWDRRLIRSA